MTKRKSFPLVLLLLFTLFISGCDSIKNKFAKEKTIDKTITECPKESCDQQFAVLPVDANAPNLKDPNSVFLAGIRKEHPNAVALYAGAYQSGGGEVTVDIPYISQPVVLFLTSYHDIHWHINPMIADTENPDRKANIVAVVYGSYDRGTQVTGVPQDIVLESKKRFGGYGIETDCSCAGGNFHCSGSDVVQDIGKLQNKYGFPVLDYYGEYDIHHVYFKNISNPVNFAIQATKRHKDLQVQKKQCESRANPNFEAMYQNDTNTSDGKEIIFTSSTSTYPISSKPNNDVSQDDATVFDNHLFKFPKTKTTWGDYLNPEHKIEDSGFTAFYINANDIKTVIKKEQVTEIAKKYAYDDFLGIPSGQFNAYWVGVINVTKPEFYNVLMNKSWSGGRVTIDRHVIIGKGKHDEEQKVFLPKGKHIVEVEYSNSWHTTDIQVKIEALSATKQPEDPTEFLSKIKKSHPKTVALYAGAYEPKDQSIVLDIPKITRPIVLYLGSYEAVKWQINNPQNTQIVGVVFGSYNKGTEVQGIAQNRVINTGKQFGTYSTNAVCHCLAKKEAKCKHLSDSEQRRFSTYKQYGIPVIEFRGKYGTDYLKFTSFKGKRC